MPLYLQKIKRHSAAETKGKDASQKVFRLRLGTKHSRQPLFDSLRIANVTAETDLLGGRAQSVTLRAAIARLLAQGAPVWLLDEPLNGLDSAAAALVETLIAGHLASGGIALVASHQPLQLQKLRTLSLLEHLP